MRKTIKAICEVDRYSIVACPMSSTPSIGNPGSLCVTRDIRQVNKENI